jgi:hypothetical protein
MPLFIWLRGAASAIGGLKWVLLHEAVLFQAAASWLAGTSFTRCGGRAAHGTGFIF